MAKFASTTIGPLSDGAVYAQNLLLPAQEGDLYSTVPGQAFDPVPTLYAQAMFAIVEFSAYNVLTDTACYVVLQTQLGDGQYIDLSWVTFNAIGNSKGVGVLTAGAFAGSGFMQTRQPGTPPSPANGSNSCPLGGQLRFIGQGNFTASQSSASSGPAGNGVYVNILYRLIGLR